MLVVELYLKTPHLHSLHAAYHINKVFAVEPDLSISIGNA